MNNSSTQMAPSASTSTPTDYVPDPDAPPLSRIPSDPVIHNEIFRSNQDIIFKLALFIPVPILFVLFITHFSRLYNNVSNILLIFHCYIEILWHLIILIGIFSAKNLRFIRSLQGYLDKYSLLSITYGVKEYPNTCVTSLSALYAIQGSLYSTGSLINAWSTLVTTMTILLLNWYKLENNAIIGGLTTGILAFMGECGLLMAIMFELNIKSKIFTILHYTGVFIYCVLLMPYSIAQEWSIFVIIWNIIAYGTLVVWFILLFSYKKTFDELKKVHTVSLYFLLPEYLLDVFAKLGLIMYLRYLIGVDA